MHKYRLPAPSGCCRFPDGSRTFRESMVSVVIPVWNDAASLRILLRYLSAEPDPVEFIVVDGGSTDEVEDVASRFARVRFLSSRLGRGLQMNTGARGREAIRSCFCTATHCPREAGSRNCRIYCGPVAPTSGLSACDSTRRASCPNPWPCLPAWRNIGLASVTKPSL